MEMLSGTWIQLSVYLHSYTHLDIYTGLNSNLNRQHHRLESRYSSSSGGSYEEEKSEYINITVILKISTPSNFLCFSCSDQKILSLKTQKCVDIKVESEKI